MCEKLCNDHYEFNFFKGLKWYSEGIFGYKVIEGGWSPLPAQVFSINLSIPMILVRKDKYWPSILIVPKILVDLNLKDT